MILTSVAGPGFSPHLLCPFIIYKSTSFSNSLWGDSELLRCYWRRCYWTPRSRRVRPQLQFRSVAGFAPPWPMLPVTYMLIRLGVAKNIPYKWVVGRIPKKGWKGRSWAALPWLYFRSDLQPVRPELQFTEVEGMVTYPYRLLPLTYVEFARRSYRLCRYADGYRRERVIKRGVAPWLFCRPRPRPRPIRPELQFVSFCGFLTILNHVYTGALIRIPGPKWVPGYPWGLTRYLSAPWIYYSRNISTTNTTH